MVEHLRGPAVLTGDATLAGAFHLDGIDPTAGFGLADLLPTYPIAPIASTLAFGTSSLAVAFPLDGLTGGAFGDPILDGSFTGTGIASTLALGT